MEAKDLALLSLGKGLLARNYHFVTATPATHRRVNSRPLSTASPLERVFGWSRPFQAIELPAEMIGLLEEAEELEIDQGLFYSKVRFSSLGEQLFVHSAFPTDAADSVFFGPDTYRFVRALRHATLRVANPTTKVPQSKAVATTISGRIPERCRIEVGASVMAVGRTDCTVQRPFGTAGAGPEYPCVGSKRPRPDLLGFPETQMS